MESPRKFNDCYFYYYSTCTKGDNCVFRHEPSALGCETMCAAWQQGKCLDRRCNLRHMELRKNRKQIPCYWENQPGGCRKMHCPFMHKNPDARTDGIAPSQPAPLMPVGGPIGLGDGLGPEQPPMVAGVPPMVQGVPPMGPGVPPAPAPAPVPLLWQQQRQVVLDSAILGVLPGSELVGRRVVAEGSPYPLPVDPLVVNFEEESDNESAPSSTPTKHSPDDGLRGARTKSQELLLLERIQAEAAAFYSYDALPPPDPERKVHRTNLNNKYDRLTLNEIAGKAQLPAERRNSLDFKVLSLDEIRARKKSETIVHTAPITINLSRKRKLSTHETLTTTGNKLLKVVRSNSIVYKKLDQNEPPVPTHSKPEPKHHDSDSRKRTFSEQSDVYEMQEDELVDNCYEFKRIKLAAQTCKPRLIRNRQSISNVSCESKDDLDLDCSNKTDNDSDSEVQIVSVEIKQHIDLDNIPDNEIIDVDSTRIGEPIDVVDLSEEHEDGDVITISEVHVDLANNVPDVVASCQRNSSNSSIICDIDAILDDDL